MKFLFTTESYPPVICGVSNVTKNICERLVSRGHTVTVATSKCGRDYSFLENVEIKEFDITGNIVTGYNGNTRDYIDFVINFECDVLVCECTQIWSTDLLLPNLEQALAKIKILHSHDFSVMKIKPKNPFSRIKWIWYYWKLSKLIWKFDRVFILNEQLKDAEYLSKISYSHVDVIPNGVDAGFFEPSLPIQIDKVKEKYGVRPHKKIFISISNYSDLKNQSFVLNAFLHSEVDADLIFIGRELNYYAYQLIDKYNSKHQRCLPKNVHFLAGLSRQEIKDLLWGSDVFLHGSKCEALPLVICESIATKTPFISTDVGCIKSFSSGVVVGSEEAMIKQIRKINELKYYDELKMNCQNERKLFCWETILDKIEGILTSMKK